jgi:hypothetical protein
VALLEQFSDELHDAEHLSSNLARATNLWQASGLGAEAFRALLFDARTRTKKRGGITKRAVGQAGEYGLTNRMPYFFACLEELLGLKGPPPQATQPQPRRATHNGSPKPPGDPAAYFAGPWGQLLQQRQEERERGDGS